MCPGRMRQGLPCLFGGANLGREKFGRLFYGRCQNSLFWRQSCFQLRRQSVSTRFRHRGITGIKLWRCIRPASTKERSKHSRKITSPIRAGRAYLAACYAQLNRMDEARAEMKAFVDAGHLEPENVTALAHERASRYRIQADREHFPEGFRKAGLKER